MDNQEQTYEFTAKGLYQVFIQIFTAPFTSKQKWSINFYHECSHLVGLKPINLNDHKQNQKRILKFLKAENDLSSEQVKFQNHLLNITKSRSYAEYRIGSIWRFLLCIVVPLILFVPTVYWLKSAPNGFFYKDPVKMTMAFMGIYIFYFVAMIFVQMPLSKILSLILNKPLSKLHTVNSYVDGEYFDPYQLSERYLQKDL